MAGSTFVHLRVHTAYSLAEGAILIKEAKPKDGSQPPRTDLLTLCKQNDMPAVAVTDSSNLFGAMEFASAAAESGIQPIIGCVLQVARQGAAANPHNKVGQVLTDQLVLLVQNERGYLNLMALVSACYCTADRLLPYVAWEELELHQTGLIALTGGPAGVVGSWLAQGQQEAAEKTLLKLQLLFGDRLYVELQRHEEGPLSALENKLEPALIDLAYKHHLPLVATNDVYFGGPDMYEAHDALLCVAEKTLVSETNRRRLTPNHYFRSAAEMRELFKDLPEACDNTVAIAKRCAYMPRTVAPILPPFADNEKAELRCQAEAGLEERLRTLGRAVDDQAYRTRLQFELDCISQMGFAGYFLIVSDFIKWAKQHDIPVGPGRGSGAGSLVAWALLITDLDPIYFGLLFERFLNPERVSMPDFDIDFCQERREAVIGYVQEKYGHDRVAQISTFGKLQARAVLRDVGRVLGLPYGYVDKICKLVPNNPANPVTLGEAIQSEPQLQQYRDEDPAIAQLMDIALKLEGLYRNASTHAAGIVIGDRPLQQLVPLYREAGAALPATQFSMKTAEQAGLVKFDFLGLKTLDVLHHATHLLAKRGIQIDLARLPLDDVKTYDLLSRGDTTGVFQLESTGMRDVMRKLRPTRFEDIIALVALYRPGPMDNIPKYTAVKNGQEKPDYLHPLLEPILKDTFGIMIYQEQVMQAAQILAGYSLGGADLLRRAMGKKKPEEMAAQRATFIAGASKKDIDAAQAGMIFDQIEKFAGYGFNKSHAAAYALVAYQTAWLKANHPVAFFAATMNFELNDTDKLNMVRQELQRKNIRLLPPDINHSEAVFALEDTPSGLAIRYALAALKGVGMAAISSVVQARHDGGPFADLFDFAARVDAKALNKKLLESLASAGAFDSLHANRAQVVANIELLAAHANASAQARNSGQSLLFADQPKTAQPKLLPAEPWNAAVRLQHEFAAVGFYLSAHPLDSNQLLLERLGVVRAGDVPQRMRTTPSSRFKLAGVVLGKTERTSKSGNRFAFVQLSDTGGSYEVTVFSEQLRNYRDLLEAGKTLLLDVDAQLGGGFGAKPAVGSESTVPPQTTDTRFIVRAITPLAEATARVSQGIRVTLTSAEQISRLQKQLSVAGKGKQRVQAVVELDELTIAAFDLPDGYQLTDLIKQQLRQQLGDAAVQEC